MTTRERLLPQVSLAIILAAGVWAACAALLALAVGHPEGVDSAGFLLAFAIVMPIAVAVVYRGGPLADVSAAALSRLAAVAAAGLAFALTIAKIADGLGGVGEEAPGVLLALIAVWLAGVALLAIRTRRGTGPLADSVSAPRAPAWMPLGLLPLFVLVLGWDVLPGPYGVALSLFLGAALLIADRVVGPAERLPRAARIGVDVSVAAAILLLVSDVTVFTPEAAAWGLQLHHDSLLGPANDVIGGRTMLVDTYSIYGFGSIYFLAGLFEVVPFGYGAFGLLVGVGLAAMYVGAYAILRLAGCAQVLAITVMAAAISSSVYTTIASPATFPSLGVLRWGFGYLLIGLAVWSVRSERAAPALWIASAAVVGVSSIWSFEVFVYTAVTYAALLAYRNTAERPAKGWLRSFAKALVPAAAACVIAHLLLAAWTLAQAGQLPDWNPYLAILREFSAGPLNRVVAQPWWVGIAVAAFLFASAVAVAVVVSRAPRLESENRAALIAIVGLTAFGIVTFTYGVRFSTDDYVARSDLPALMVMALWVSVAGRSGLARPARTVLAATVFWVAALLVVAGWPHLEREAGRTPLIAALPDNGRSVESEVSRAWGNPELQPRAPAAEMLLDRYWPGAEEALMLLHPDLAVEVLMRTGRVNLLPVSDSLTDDMAAEERWDQVRPVVDGIDPGTLILTERFYLDPEVTRDYPSPGSVPLPLEQMIIDRIRERFRLRPVAAEQVGFDPVMGDDELVVMRLLERS